MSQKNVTFKPITSESTLITCQWRGGVASSDYKHDWQLLGRLHRYPTIHNTSSSHRTNKHCLSRFMLLSPKISHYTYRSGCSSRSFVLFTCISTTTQTSSSGTFFLFSSPEVSPKSCFIISFDISLLHIPLHH